MIGFFDSGVGGLSVASEVKKILPQVPIIYFADTAHVPYGEKSSDFILTRSIKVSEYLISCGVKILVIACNTATAVAAEELRRKLEIPVIAVEPPIKPASVESVTKVVGVVATEVTLKSDRFKRLSERYAGDVKLVIRSSNDLVNIVEAGDFSSEDVVQKMQRITDDFLAQNVDTVVLGSTHFYFLANLIEKLSGGKIKCLAPSEPIAKQVKKIIEDHQIVFSENRKDKFVVSAEAKQFKLKLDNFYKAVGAYQVSLVEV